MKILEDKVKNWSKQVKCSSCDSEIEFCASDVFYQSLGSFDDFSLYYSIKCPACNQTHDLKQLPLWIKNQAKKL